MAEFCCSCLLDLCDTNVMCFQYFGNFRKSDNFITNFLEVQGSQEIVIFLFFFHKLVWWKRLDSLQCYKLVKKIYSENCSIIFCQISLFRCTTSLIDNLDFYFNFQMWPSTFCFGCFFLPNFVHVRDGPLNSPTIKVSKLNNLQT